MATLTIRNIDDETKRLLRQRAARHERSMEEEVRQILRSAVHPRPTGGKPLGDLLVELSRPGVVLPDVRDRTPHEPIAL
jgi:plasmid stability protein